MNNAVMRKIPVTAQYKPLTDKDLEVLTIEITASPSNVSDVFFLGDDGSEVPLIPGEYHLLNRVDLRQLKCRGTLGDFITLVGGTW